MSCFSFAFATTAPSSSSIHHRHRHHHAIPPAAVRTESSDLLSVLDQLDTDTLSDSRVGLLGLDTDLLEDDTLGVGGSTERRGLEGGSQKTLLEGQIGPALLTAVVAQLARGVETSWLSCSQL